MVATDVASRGIGMIDCKLALPFPFPSFQMSSCGSVRDAMLSAIYRSVAATLWSRLIVSSFGSLVKRILEIQCSVACYAFYSVSLRTIWVQRRMGLFLNSSSCISKDCPG